jgi:heme-degrading monooxygenase HmoA
MTVTLINPFIVPAEMSDEEFLRRWHEASDRLTTMPGFIEAHFYRNTDDVDQTFRFVNVALWESAESYRDAFDGPPQTPDDSSGVKFFPGLFQPAVNVEKS